MIAQLKIGSLNVNGVSDCDRMYRVITTMLENNIDIMTLQDTHVTVEKAEEYEDRYPKIGFLASVEEGEIAGVMILINRDTVEWAMDDLAEVNDWEDATGRVLIAPVKTIDTGIELTVGCCYAPARRPERMEWSNRLLRVLGDDEDMPKCDILCGDWNVVSRPEDNGMGNTANVEDLECHRNVHTEMMRLGGNNADGWRIQHPNEKVWTHRNTAFAEDPDRGKSRIDRIYVRTDWIMSTKDWLIVPNAMTDHSLIMMTYRPTNIAVGRDRWRAPALSLELPDVLKECRMAMIRIFGNATRSLIVRLPAGEERQRQCEDILNRWKQWKDEVQKIIRGHYNRIQIKVRFRKHTLRLKAQRSQTSPAAAEALLMEVKEMEENDRKDYCYNSYVRNYIVGERPNAYFYNRVKTAKKQATYVRQLREENMANATTDPTEMVGMVRRFYEDLYSPKNSDAEARRTLLQNVDRKIPDEFRRTLTAPIVMV